MSNIYINSDELKETARNIKIKMKNIMETYQKILSLCNDPQNQIDELNSNQTLNTLTTTFTNLNTRINKITDFLINTVANEYDDAIVSIKKEFNGEIANEIASLIKLQK